MRNTYRKIIVNKCVSQTYSEFSAPTCFTVLNKAKFSKKKKKMWVYRSEIRLDYKICSKVY